MSAAAPSRRRGGRDRRADAPPSCGATLRPLKPYELRPGLWRWSAPHPEWQPTSSRGTPTDWPRDVACVLYETAQRAIFIDALVGEGAAAFWGWADARCRGREVVVLETVAYHRRSREEFLARYSASTAVPPSVAALLLAVVGETLYWIPEHRALVPGDVLVGTGAGELALCPQSWLEDLSAPPTRSELLESLGVLSDLDVELVLVSHGDPALGDGRAALARALGST